MDESLAEFYYKQLMGSTNPVPILVNFLASVLDSSEDNKLDKHSLYPLFARLVKVFGSRIPFMAIIDCGLMTSVTNKDIGGLIIFLTKKRFDQFMGTVPETIDLTNFAKEKRRRLLKPKRKKEGIDDEEG